jgi:integrase/recombinase XerC
MASIRPAWLDFLGEWDWSLRAANRSVATRQNYLLAVRQLAGFLAGPDVAGFVGGSVVEAGAELEAAVESPVWVRRGQVRWFLSWMIETRSAVTALNKYKGLQQFFRYLVLEDEIADSPIAGIPQPAVLEKVVPVVEDPDLVRLLSTCSGRSFCARRDTALIRLFMDTGVRLAEGTLIGCADVDLVAQLVLVRGKGGHERRVPFGEKTALALVRYLRVRSGHAGAELSALFLSDQGLAMSTNATKLMFVRRGRAAGVGHMHAHRLRHTLAHEWQVHEGNETDLMAIMGWRSPQMLRRYGRSAAEVRAQRSHRRLGLGNRV